MEWHLTCLVHPDHRLHPSKIRQELTLSPKVHDPTPRPTIGNREKRGRSIPRTGGGGKVILWSNFGETEGRIIL